VRFQDNENMLIRPTPISRFDDDEDLRSSNNNLSNFNSSDNVTDGQEQKGDEMPPHLNSKNVS